MNQAPYDPLLFAELYDVQPKAVIWATPIWDASQNSIEDFEFVYANSEGLNYLQLTREKFTGLRLSASPTLDDNLRSKVQAEMVRVYLTGEVSHTSIYNAALNKY